MLLITLYLGVRLGSTSSRTIGLLTLLLLSFFLHEPAAVIEAARRLILLTRLKVVEARSAAISFVK